MIFVTDDQAIYEGGAVRNEQGVAFGGLLVRGQLVTVVRPNEDDEDDVIVRKVAPQVDNEEAEADRTYRVDPSELNWREGPS